MTYQLGEEDRQLTILGLALMSLNRPGFENACRRISKVLVGEEMYDSFRDSNNIPGNLPRDTVDQLVSLNQRLDAMEAVILPLVAKYWLGSTITAKQLQPDDLAELEELAKKVLKK